jgi:quercetin dioxygenase-like cupin family protein
MKVTRNIKPEYIDERGGITRILDTDEAMHSILFITSKAGSVRSNHYHKKDTHYCYIISGKAEWYEKPVEGGAIEKEILNAGDMVFTPANTIHTVKFLEDTEFLVFSTEPRNQEHYEEDTVRVKLID